jgi:hypothetical protein
MPALTLLFLIGVGRSGVSCGFDLPLFTQAPTIQSVGNEEEKQGD